MFSKFVPPILVEAAEWSVDATRCKVDHLRGSLRDRRDKAAMKQLAKSGYTPEQLAGWVHQVRCAPALERRSVKEFVKDLRADIRDRGSEKALARLARDCNLKPEEVRMALVEAMTKFPILPSERG